jgi:hypothetical protein
MRSANDTATLAVFVDYKTVKTRRTMQLIFEVPYEGGAADKALAALGGTPDPASPPWVGIARVQPKATSEPLKAAERPRKRWRDSTPTFQASIRCGEPLFREYIGAETEADAADFVRVMCGVTTRANIIQGEPSGDAWEQCESRYQAWLSERQYAEVIR